MATPRILIAEDENLVAKDIKNCLIGLGYEVTATVSTGREAIQQAEANPPDLVLIDIRLKGEMDGVEVAEEIRHFLDIPIIYLTALSDEFTLQRAMWTDPYGYILKPFDERELRTTIEIALHKHQLGEKIKESERWLATTLRSIGDALVVTDARGTVRFVNPTAETLTGWLNHEATGKNLSEIFDICDSISNKKVESVPLKALTEGSVITQENITLTSRDGDQYLINNSTAPIRDEECNVIGAVLVFRKSGEETQDSVNGFYGIGFGDSAQMAAEAAQLASLGVMATGITCEIKQPLQQILMDVNHLLSWQKACEMNIPDSIVEKLNNITDGIDKVFKIIKRLDSFWKPSDQKETEIFNLNEAVVRATKQLQDQIKSRNVTVKTCLLDEELKIKGTSRKFEQIVANLAYSSISAFKKGAQGARIIEISTSYKNNRAVLEVQCNRSALESTSIESFPQSEESTVDVRFAITEMLIRELNGHVYRRMTPARNIVFTAWFPTVLEEVSVTPA